RGELERSLSRLVNRLTFSILLLAFSLLIAALVIAGALSGNAAPPWGVPVIEIGATLLALAVAVLFWAILRSGRF
ncbi:MAG TPA: AarF/ABC1/UbiB kinase family protein, partial [Bacillota bacterium]